MKKKYFWEMPLAVYCICMLALAACDNATTGSANVPIRIAEITGVDAPEIGETPVTSIDATNQFTGTVSWRRGDETITNPAEYRFQADTQYTATITLTPRTGFTLRGVAANHFTVEGTSTPAANAANSGVVTATFPATGTTAPATVTVSFNTNGGEPVAIDSVTVPTGTALGDEFPAEPARDEHIFEGWFAQGDTTFENEFTEETLINADVTLVARWVSTQATVTVSFNTNGGEPAAIDSVTVPTGTALGDKFPAEPARDSHTFEGWFAQGDTAFANEFTATTLIDADVTLEARWVSVQVMVTVSFNTNGGEPATIAPITIGLGTTLGGQFPTAPTKDGHTFEGWFAQSDTTFENEFTTATLINANVTLVARWVSTQVPDTIDITIIPGVTRPATGGTRVTTITATTQFTGTVSWSPNHAIFEAETQYTATITLAPKAGYTLNGVPADFFRVAGAAATNAGNSGVVTAVFPATAHPGGATPIYIAEIPLPVPVTGATPLREINTLQYTGTVTWTPPVPSTFQSGTEYMATVTLTARDGYTLHGVPANFFTVEGAEAGHGANSGMVLVSFPRTDRTINIGYIPIVSLPVAGATPGSAITETSQFTGTVLTWMPPHPTFQAGVSYSAIVSLTARAGYTLTGVPANFFRVEGADPIIHAAASGDFTVFFQPTPNPITISEIGLRAPEVRETPATSITATTQYTGSVSWRRDSVPITVWQYRFQPGMQYTAVITLTPVMLPSPGYSVQSLPEGFFTVEGAEVSYEANSGVITAVFPPTPSTINIAGIPGVTPPAIGAAPVTAITDTTQFTGTVSWSAGTEPIDDPQQYEFREGIHYTATINLEALTGFTLYDVAADFFTVADAMSVSNAVDCGIVTAQFPAIVNMAIPDVTAPVAGAIPVTTIETTQFTGTVSWSPELNPTHTVFEVLTVYTATINLTPKDGFTLSGVPAGFFDIEGADTTSNDANSGAITAVFPKTDPPGTANEVFFWLNDQGEIVTGTATVLSRSDRDTATFTMTGTGFTNHRWYVNGRFESSASSFAFHSAGRDLGDHNIDLTVWSNNRPLGANFTVTVIE